jgi:hypothetical protein
MLAHTATTHMNHHKDVNMDMYLESNKVSTDLHFGWETLLDIIINMIFSPLMQKLLKLNFKQIFIINIIVSILYCVLWNNIHMDVHGIKKKIGLKQGITNFPGLLSRGPIYNYLWKYHATHHLQKGDLKRILTLYFQVLIICLEHISIFVMTMKNIAKKLPINDVYQNKRNVCQIMTF